ncbi:MAG: hypothetical protein U0822_13685 [Anaerolineae bacterium]
MMTRRVSWWHQLITVVSVVAVMALALFPALSPSVALADRNTNPGVLPPQSHPYGKTYGEWGDMWWQWLVAIPAAANPSLDVPGDTTGTKCGKSQSGPVWFLAGIFGTGTATRNCTMPSGKAIFIPVANAIYIWSPPDDPHNRNFLWVLQQARGFYTPQSLSASIDGDPVRNLSNYYVESAPPGFNVDLSNPGNIFDVVIAKDDTNPSAQVGTYLMLAPLSVGTHTLRIYADFGGGNTMDVTYILKVVPAGRYGK